MDTSMLDKKTVQAMKKAEYMKKYYKLNTDRMKGTALKRYSNNRHELMTRQSEYYKDNKDRYLQKYKCVCGGSYMFVNKNRHYKTMKHHNYITPTPTPAHTPTIKIRILNIK